MLTDRAARDAALLALERETRPEAREEAAVALFDFARGHPDARPELVEVLPRLLTDKQVGIRQLGLGLGALILPADEAEALLSSRVSDPEPELRLEAVGQLADLALPTSRGAFAAALSDPDPAVRFEAARGMAAVGHSAGLEVLLEALEDRLLRFRAINALSELGDPRAEPALRKVFKKWLVPAFDRTQAAGALAQMGDPEGAAYLLRRARAKNKPDRPLAVELCGEVKAVGAARVLLEVLSDPKDPCRGAAARGLGRLGDVAALAPLAKLLEDASAFEDLRLDAAEGLLLLDVPEARRAVERAAASLPTKEGRAELSAMLADLTV